MMYDREEEYQILLGSFALGDLTPADFRRRMREHGIDEDEIEELIEQLREGVV